MKIILLCISTIFMCLVPIHADKFLSQIEKSENAILLIKLSLWHSLTGDKMTQEIEVSESTAFNVVTTLKEIRWTVKGALGKIKVDKIPVDLSVEWYKNSTSNLLSKHTLTLKLGEKEESSGGIHGVIVTASIRKRGRLTKQQTVEKVSERNKKPTR